MRILAVLAVVVLLIVAAFFFFGGGELAIAPKPTPTAAAAGAANTDAQDYSALGRLLTQDMASIPQSLDAPRVTPANAFNIKSRLAGAATPRPEYQTLAQVCDLIIFADKEHSVRQRQDQEAAQNVTGDAMATARANQLSTSATRTGLHAKAQSDWEVYRQQTDAEVHRLLATLPGAKS